MKDLSDMTEWDIIKYGCITLLTGALAIAYWPITSVNTGYRGVVTVGGAIKGIEGEGFTIIAPWQKLHQFNIRAEQTNVDNAVASTSDQQPVSVALTVRYNIPTDKVSEVFEKYSKDGDLQSYVNTSTLEVFKSVTARYTAPELISKRAEVSEGIVEGLRTKLATYDANVISVDMRDFSFDQKYMDTILAKVNQEQLKLVAENKILTIQAEQKAKVVESQATADALRIQAEGDAFQIERMAKAQAAALTIQNDALVKSREVLELRRIEVEMKKAEQWDGKLPTAIYGSAPLPLMNIK
jgi:regulator of protease activity HflC (stomatin/prohibitin superfamily)